MGWTYGWTNPGEMVRELTESWENDAVETKTIRRCWRGWRRVWTVVEQTEKATGKVERFVVLYLIEGNTSEGWGYKAIEDSCGPVETDCPPSYLDLLTEPTTDWGRAWREKVRAKRKTPAPGLRVKYGSVVYKLLERTAKRARSWYVRSEETGSMLIMSGSQVADSEVYTG